MKKMSNKNVIIGAVAILAIIFGIAYLKQTTVNVAVGNSPQSYGATPGNSVDGKYFSIGGQQFYRTSFPVTATSSVLCSVQNPFPNATTTVLANGTGINVTAGILGANTFDVSTSSTAYASSTPAFSRGVSVPSSGTVTYPFNPRYGTTTATTVFQNGGDDGIWQIADVVSPTYPYVLTGTQYLTWRVATATPGTGTFQGTCSFYGVKN